uniref:NADH-ubiquinone oxidoreductase chain 4L n=1 Tax=Ciidae sp. GENSP01 TaxID=1205545 RepID=A0A0S2MS27_9CUCU|nr:NADH deshydrogenase subunit 4L [Ciidae sp. GENSP01]
MTIFLFNFIIMFFSGLIAFSIKRKHLLLMLLSLEYIVLSVFVLIYFGVLYQSVVGFISMFFLTFSVCEGVLGLSIMISLIRTHGNDYFQSFNVLW